MAHANQLQRRQSLFGFGFLLQAIHTWLLNSSSPDDQPMKNTTGHGLESVGRRV